MFEQTRQRVKDRARQETNRQLETAKTELTRFALEVLEKQFPERMKHRRRRHVLEGFLAGIAVGILIRHLLER